jgi:hypothetical protein
VTPLPQPTAIPETWATLEDFADWYRVAGFPMLPPAGFQSFRTDDAVAFCTFRRGQYQAEIYIVDDPVNVPEHEHPFVEVIQYFFDRDGKGGEIALPYQLGPKLAHGMSHGAFAAERGWSGKGIFYTMEKWPRGVTPSTVSAVWKGGTVGPLHDALIRRFFPDAYIKDGYADITRSAMEVSA